MNNSRWADIYSKKISAQGPLNYVAKKAREKKVLIETIVRNTPEGGRILEAGCGTGAISIYLSSLGYDVLALDADEEVLKLASDTSRNFPQMPRFVLGDITQLGYAKDSFDLSFSNGVLEHFSDGDILKVLRQQSESCKRVIFSVPSVYFRPEEKIYGNERFLARKKWRGLIEQAGAQVIDEFEFSYREDTFFENMAIFLRAKLKVIKPYIGFVIEDRNKSYKHTKFDNPLRT